MNERERFVQTMAGGSPDRPSYGDYFAYDSTRERWEREGLPRGVNLYRHFGFDHIDIWGADCVPWDWGFSNRFERQLLEAVDDYEIWRETDGSINKHLKNTPPPAMPQHLAPPITDRSGWEAWRQGLHERALAPLDRLLEERAASWAERTTPLGFWPGSSYGVVRGLFGVENLSLLIYDEPALIQEIVESLTDVYEAALQRVAARVRLDWVMFWEDMAYKTGSLVSPALYRQLFVPFYRRIMPLVESAGVPVVMLDSDGNVDDLIPIWMDLGITTMHPMEVAAGMDVRTVRQRYGKSVKFFGGIDKRPLAKDRKAIAEEVLPKIHALRDDGGFIVQCDHAVPPDVSYDNYRYFRDLVRKAFED